jgi:hypothetical protein
MNDQGELEEGLSTLLAAKDFDQLTKAVHDHPVLLTPQAIERLAGMEAKEIDPDKRNFISTIRRALAGANEDVLAAINSEFAPSKPLPRAELADALTNFIRSAEFVLLSLYADTQGSIWKGLRGAIDVAALGLAEVTRNDDLQTQAIPRVSYFLELLPWNDPDRIIVVEALAGAYINRANSLSQTILDDQDAPFEDYVKAIELREGLRNDLGAEWKHRADLRNSLAVSYMRRGIAATDTRRDAAIADLRQAAAIQEALRSDLGVDWESHQDLRADLARTYVNLGNALRDPNMINQADAIAEYDRALVLMEALRQDIGQAWEEHNILNDNLAHIFLNRGSCKQDSANYDLDDAIADYDLAIELMENQLRLPTATRDNRLRLAKAYLYRASARRVSAACRPASSVADCDAAIALLESVRAGHDEPVQNDLELCGDLMEAYVWRGSARLESGESSNAALGDYDQAILLGEALRSDLGREWYRRIELRDELANAYEHRGSARTSNSAYGPDIGILDFDLAVAFREDLRQDLSESWSKHVALRNRLACTYMNRAIAKGSSAAYGSVGAIVDFDRAVELMDSLRADLDQTWNGNVNLRRSFSNVYMNRGNAKGESSDYGPDAALADYDLAIPMMEAVKQDLGKSWEGRIGLRKELASAYMNRGIERLATGVDKAGAAIGDYTRAIEILEALQQSLGSGWVERAEFPRELAKAYMHRGNAKSASNAYAPEAAISDHDKAIGLMETLQESLRNTLSSRTELRREIAVAYLNRGAAKVTGRARNPRAAIADYDRAIALLNDLVGDAGEWLGRSRLIAAFAGKAHCHAHLQQWNQVWDSCQEVFRSFEVEFEAAVTPTARREALKSLRGLAATAALASVRCGANIISALDLLERGRAVQLREALALDDATVARVKPNLLDEFRSLKVRLQLLQDEFERRDVRDHSAIYREGRDTRARLVAILREAGVDPLSSISSMKVTSITMVVPDHGALLAPVITEYGSLMLVCLKDSAGRLRTDYIDLPDAQEDVFDEEFGSWMMAYFRMRIVATKYQEAVEDQMLSDTALKVIANDRDKADEAARNAIAALATWVGRSIMGPVLKHLSSIGLLPASRTAEIAPELLIAATGSLSFVPFHAAILDDGTPPTTVLDGYAVSYMPSVGLLAAAREHAKSRDGVPAALVAALDPDGTLPGAEAERKFLERLFDPSKRSILIRDQATKSAIVAAIVPTKGGLQARITHHHYACHGDFNPNFPERSALVLANGERWTAHEILSTSGLCDNCRLAVLSACETAMADFLHLPDEGMGLVMAFLVAGAAGVLATQWAVQDDAAAHIIERFYELYLGHDGETSNRKHLSPVQALRLAMIELRGVSSATLSSDARLPSDALTTVPQPASGLVRLGDLTAFDSTALGWAPFTIWGT